MSKYYALYRGDKFLFLGTRKEVAEYMGIRHKSVTFYGTPTYLKRIKNYNKCYIVVKIEEE